MNKSRSSIVLIALMVSSLILFGAVHFSTAQGGTIITTPTATIAVGTAPYGIAYDSGKSEIFVTNLGADSVSVISDSTNAVVANVTVGSYPDSVAYDAGTGEVFVANQYSDTVSVISDSTNTVVATVNVGTEPVWLCYDSGKGEIFVTNQGSNTVSVISDSTNTVVATVTVGNYPMGIAYDSGKGEIFVANYDSGSVSVISESTNAVVATVTVGINPESVAYNSAKGEVFVANAASNTVSVISDSTNAVVANVTVGNRPAGVAYDSGTGEVFVANYLSSSVSVISDSTNDVVATVTVGTSPASVAYDSAKGEVFVANDGSNTVSVISDGSTPTPSPSPTSTPTSTPISTPTPTTAPNLPSPNLSFNCISSTATTGFNVQIQGSLTYNGVGLSDEGIQLSDSVTGGATWQDLTYVNTDNNGSFSCVWNPSVSGNYGIEATWSGDSDYSNASAVYNFAVAPFNNQEQNVFSVTSNSTLTSLTFDSATNELSFGVSGPSGTTGLTTVCIPQSLIPDISKLNVMLDGSAINYTSVSEDNVWIIAFTYHHSSHTVVIELGSSTSTVPEVATWIILPLFTIVMLLSIVFIKKRITKK
jgi:YVTN family beta-propeller protein